jgi:DNA-binding NarL/FixJ family response regulator
MCVPIGSAVAQSTMNRVTQSTHATTSSRLATGAPHVTRLPGTVSSGQSGSKPMSAAPIAAGTSQTPSTSTSPPAPHSSPAEREVALLLVKGLSSNEIATVRATSERTVRQQSQAVYRKAGVAGRAELAAFFLEDLLLPGSLPIGALD